MLWVSSADGTLVAHLGVDNDGGAFWVSNRAGDSVAFVGSDAETQGVLWLNNENNDSVATLGVDDDGGFLRQENHADEAVVLIAADTGGGGGFISVSVSRVHDIAEVFDLETREGVVPGSVMSVDALGSGALMPAATPYDRKVVGVISGAGDFQHAMLIGSRKDGSHACRPRTGRSRPAIFWFRRQAQAWRWRRGTSGARSAPWSARPCKGSRPTTPRA